jgi:hypothetical protein
VAEPAALDADVLRRLYTTAPSKFVATRTELVKEARKGGDRATAAAFAALRKPSAAEWALNVTAVRHPDAVDAFLKSAAGVRDAQTAAASGAKGPDVREALRELRTATARVLRLADGAVTTAGAPSGSLNAAITACLGEMVASEEAGAQFRTARLGSGPIATTDPFAAVPDRPAASKAPVRDESPKRKRELDRAVETATARVVKAADQLAQADGRVADAHKAVADAERALARHRATLERATSARAEAQSKCEQAQSALAEAESARDAADDRRR